MAQLILDVPDSLAERLSQRAAELKKSIEQVAVERLCAALEADDERKRYEPISDERLRELADKFGALGPVSDLVLEERRQGY